MMLNKGLKLLMAATVALPLGLALSADASANGFKKFHHGGFKSFHGKSFKKFHHRGFGKFHHRGFNRFHHGGFRTFHGKGFHGKSFKKGFRKHPSFYYGGGVGGAVIIDNSRSARGGILQRDVLPQDGDQQFEGQRADGSFDYGQCEDVRAYQTTIEVDGQPVEAMGVACLLPDGSWVAGPIQFNQ